MKRESQQRGRCLAVDVGNSAVKCGVFMGNALEASVRIEGVSVEAVAQWAHRMGAEQAIVSVVRDDGELFCASMSDYFPTHRLTGESAVPFESRYATPTTLGADRLASMAAVYTLYGGEDVVVVDAGTALTCDYMGRSGVYEGGTISPGLGMRFRSLHEHTGALPFVGLDSYRGVPGRTTRESIAGGVVGGVLSEIVGFLQIMTTFATDLRLVLTGGDGEYLSKRLGRPCEFRRELVLEGLNAILQYNAE